MVTMGLLTENEMAQGLAVADSDSRDVSRFLNRILGLQVALQNLVRNSSSSITESEYLCLCAVLYACTCR